MRKTLQADVINATTTVADVTGFSFPVTAGRTYDFRFKVDATTNATTTGIQLAVNGPAMTRITYDVTTPSSLTAKTVCAGINALDGFGTPPTTSAAIAGNTCIVEGTCTPSADGSVVLRNKASVAVAAANTVKAGSNVTYFEVK